MNQRLIRNFSIIAHIDHGKSTLADRLLEMTGTIQKRDMQEQILDSNPIERERGITIKLAPVRMIYKPGQLNHASLSNSSNEMQNAKIKYQNDNEKIKNGSSILNFDFYTLNLIDTPGHVDFNYEVSRSLAACEGALLVVDATQGVQAQTLANLNLARKQNLAIIPIINKIDLPNAQIDSTIKALNGLGFSTQDILLISAKTGKGVDRVLKAVVERIPPPKGIPSGTLRALVFSSQFDTHKGVVVYVRIVDGSIVKTGPAAGFLPRKPARGPLLGSPSSRVTRLKFMISGAEFEPIELGYFAPKMVLSQSLLTGEVGYIATGLKDVKLAKVGDTITINQKSKIKNQNDQKNPQPTTHNLQPTTHLSDVASAKADNPQPLPGYKEPKPMVFLGLYPIQTEEINLVREALGKLRLSDSAFTFKPIHSLALGNGFHCGFLGLLHAEVVQERLSREFNLNLLATAPTVEYKIKIKNQKSKIKIEDDDYFSIQSPAEFPDPSLIEQSFEPVMEVAIFSPKIYVGAIMQLCQAKRAEFIDLNYIAEQAKFTYLMPLSEMIVDFFDNLKSVSEGYASLDYEFFDFQPVDLVKMDILLNHEKVDAFSQLVVKDRAVEVGRNIVDKLKDVIPRHQFAVPVQATIGGKVIARSDVKPFRKDVTQKLYGGDRTRKDKLLEAQKKGKKKMKTVGRVEIPQEAFLEVFKRG